MRTWARGSIEGVLSRVTLITVVLEEFHQDRRVGWLNPGRDPGERDLYAAPHPWSGLERGSCPEGFVT